VTHFVTTYLLHPLVGRGYQWWSGLGSDFGELAIIGTILGVARRTQCHQQGCWRIGRFRHGHLVLCHRHHPLVPDDGRITAAHIAAVTSPAERNPRTWAP